MTAERGDSAQTWRSPFPLFGTTSVCSLCGRVPVKGERHRAVFPVGQTGEDAEEVCVGPDRRQLDCAPLPDHRPDLGDSEDPW